MPHAVLQNHYCVAALQHPLSYNGDMGLYRMRGRIARSFFLLMAALAAVGLLAACGNDSILSVRDTTALAATSRTISDLDQAGYSNARIGLEAGSGLSADGQVDVSYSVGPAANAENNVNNAERIVWNTLRYRFGVLTVSQTSGVCAPGWFCESSSTEIGNQTYAQLLGEFGPRPARLDKTSVSQSDPVPSWLPGVLSALAAGLVAAVIWARRRRLRDSAGRALTT
jgi:hypothetical protein